MANIFYRRIINPSHVFNNKLILIENIKLISLVAKEITTQIKITKNKLNSNYWKYASIFRLEL